MQYKQLGRTGLYVSELCLGTMTLGGHADAGMWAAIGAVEQDGATRLIARALAAGINFIDTADVYSFGQSERLVGQASRASSSAPNGSNSSKTISARSMSVLPTTNLHVWTP